MMCCRFNCISLFFFGLSPFCKNTPSDILNQCSISTDLRSSATRWLTPSRSISETRTRRLKRALKVQHQPVSLPLYICSFFLVNEKSPVDIVPSRGCSVQSEGGDRVRVHGDCYIDGRALCWHAGMLACWCASRDYPLNHLYII